MQFERVLTLEGVHNFRDFGGYAVTGGGRLRPGILWRSGQHHGATDEDLARIDALGLAHVFDLRTGRERATHPCRRPDGFGAQVYHTADPDPQQHAPQQAPHLAAGQAARGRDTASARQSMVNNYRTIAFRPQLVDSMRQLLAVLAEEGRPTLVNCMAGKDRTGIAVAAVHLALGVHEDDALADYVLTNTAGDPEARIASGMKTISAMASGMTPEVARVMMGVEPEYLVTAFESMRERHGSTDGYLREVLGVDEALRGRLRERLVEG